MIEPKGTSPKIKGWRRAVIVAAGPVVALCSLVCVGGPSVASAATVQSQIRPHCLVCLNPQPLPP